MHRGFLKGMDKYNEIKKNIIYCPICNNMAVKIIYRYKEMHIYKCSFCYMMFQDRNKPAPCDNYIEKFYGKSSFNARLKIEERRMNRILSHIKNDFAGLRVLEIGSGSGILATLLIKNGAFYYGIEPDPFFYNKILENFPEVKELVYNCSLSDANIQKDSYDIIIMVDTLEHIAHPNNFLRELNSYLKANGKLYIEVPNESLLSLKGCLRKVVGLYSGYPAHPSHVNMFTRASLKRLLCSAGFNSKISQLSILGDYARMSAILGHDDNLLVRLICVFFQLTKLDIIFQQGNILAVAYKANL